MTDLTADQLKAIDKLATALLVIPAEDRVAAIALMTAEYRKAAIEAAPDLPPEKITAAVSRFGNLVSRRFDELLALGGDGGHA